MIKKKNRYQKLQYTEPQYLNSEEEIAEVVICKENYYDDGINNKWVIHDINFLVSQDISFEEKFEWYEKIKKEVDNYIKTLKE